jgi:NADH dehydrogenase FAD-containing subunit
VSGRHLLLLGGGHAHLEVVRRLRARPDWKITMISPQPGSAYSGRLPAVVAGRLEASQLWLPLQKLCLRAGIEFCQDSVESFQLGDKRVVYHSGRSVPFDLLSINVGSQPPGIFSGALPVRPLATFLTQLEGLLSRCVGGDLAVVGEERGAWS